MTVLVEERIKVRDLLRLLEAAPQDAWVEIQGCDCMGFAGGLDEPYEDEDEGTVVTIKRAGWAYRPE